MANNFNGVPEIRLTLNRKTIKYILSHMFYLIESNSLFQIVQVFQILHPDQRTRVMNSTINGRTPLFFAIESRKGVIAHFLLELSVRQGSAALSNRWKTCRHPLMIAMSKGNIEMIGLISNYLFDINDYFHGTCTPLMIAVLMGDSEYLRLLVRLEADINTTCFNATSPLMVATYSEHFCRYLISANADLDHQDNDGYTALHIAIARKENVSLKILVEAGADVHLRNDQGISAVMWAALHLNIPAVFYLFHHSAYSELDRIEVLEILGASCVYNQMLSFTYWQHALKMRNGTFSKETPFPAQKILDFAREFTTDSELFDIINQPLKLAFQAVLVVERIIGRNNSTYLLYILNAAMVAKNVNKMTKLRQLIDYIEEYCQSCPAKMISICSERFMTLFLKITEEGDTKSFIRNKGISIFRLIAQTACKMWPLVKNEYSSVPYVDDHRYITVVDNVLHMASIICNMNLPLQYFDQFCKVVADVIEVGLRAVNLQSLLHRAVKYCKRVPWGSVGLIRLLLASGADVNSKDFFRRTPLMYVLKHVPGDSMREVAGLLLEYGAHKDCRNDEAFTAMEFLRWTSLPIPQNPRSLQCLAANAILDSEIAYQNVLPKIVSDFVTLHG